MEIVWPIDSEPTRWRMSSRKNSIPKRMQAVRG